MDQIPFSSLDKIRTFVKSHQGKTITPSNPIVFEQFKTLLSSHPTWKDKLDSIEKIHIGLGFTKQSTVVKIKPVWSPKFVTISWRKCHVTKKRNCKNENYTTPPSVFNPSDMVSSRDVDLFQLQTSPLPPLPNVNTDSDKLTQSMRYAIRRQIFHWKTTHQLNRKCQQCPSILHLHVDHINPFVDIKKDFLILCQEHNLTLPTEFAFNRKTCQPKFKKTDASFCARWQRYHLKHAKLQWLCASCNLSKGKRIVK